MNDNVIINSLFLLNDCIFEHKFSVEELKTINEYKLRDLYIKKDTKFDIDYILDLFTNFEFNHVCDINKNNLKFKS